MGDRTGHFPTLYSRRKLDFCASLFYRMRSVHIFSLQQALSSSGSDSESLDTDPKGEAASSGRRGSRMTVSKLSLKEQNMLDEKILRLVTPPDGKIIELHPKQVLTEEQRN